MVASSRVFSVASVLVVLGVAVACGGSSKSVGDDDSSGTGGGGGTKASGGTGNATSAGGSGNATSAGGSGATGGSTSSGGKGGSATSGTGGTTSTSGSGGTGGDPVSVMIGNCPDFSPCGGDVVGTWKMSSLCGASDTSNAGSGGMAGVPSCATDGTTESANSDVVITFGSDGSYSAKGTITISLDFTFDDTCAMASFGVDAATTCAVLAAAGGSAMTGGSLSCAPKDADCSCHFTSDPSETDDEGTYTISGDEVTLNYVETDSDGTTTPYMETDPYCVDGDTLTTDSANMGNGGLLTLKRD
ncbi:MAG TPA: hypothetical protein VMI54_02840 [Polyangiaceae bacterium]|nr:hypothetical protein [Polyangiaceae bacterium]